jgi:hypothetical protein
MNNYLSFTKQLSRLLQENEGYKNLAKKLLKEADEKTCSSTYSSAPTLKMACVYDCFKQGTTVKDGIPGLPTGQYAVSPSTKYPGYPFAILSPIPQGQTSGELRYADASLKTFKVDGTTNQTFVGRWSCPAITQTMMDSFSPDLEQALERMKTYTNGQVVSYSVGAAKPISDGFKSMKLVDAIKTIIQDPQQLQTFQSDPGVSKYLNTALVYVQGGPMQYQGARWAEDKKAWEGAGYTEGPCPMGEEYKCRAIDMSDCKTNPNTCKEYTAGKYFMHRNINQGQNDTIAKELKGLMDKANGSMSKEDCKAYIEKYISAKDAGVQIGFRIMDTYKDTVNQCNKNHNFSKLGGLIGGVEKRLNSTEFQYGAEVADNYGNVTDYSLNKRAGTTTTVAREGLEDKNLKNLIRESLLDIKRTKKKIGLGENKIIKNRFNILSENRIVKTKSQKQKLIQELFVETAYLNSQGYDTYLINETFLDTLKGLFGTAADSTLQYFKEQIAKWLIEKLTPMDPNGWMANIIITAVGNVPVGEITRLTECNYLSDVLTKSIVEGAINKYKNEAGMEGAFYDILRNGIVEMLEDTKFGQTVESAIGKLVCPLLGGVAEKMQGMGDSMKKGALSLV